MTTSAIHIHQLNKTYKTFFSKNHAPAIQNLDLSIQKGEVWALIGPNGAGKSTTLHCLTGLFHPDNGEIKIFEKNPLDPETRNHMGFQSEIFFTYPYRSANQVLRFYGELHGMKDPHLSEKIENVLELVGLKNVQHQKTGTFSKGMVQRLGLAQSILHDPDLLIWDEPSSGLDPEGRKLVIDLLRDMKQKGKTILFSTHVLDDIEKVCDHVAMINKGKILFADSFENLSKNHPGESLENIYLDMIKEKANE